MGGGRKRVEELKPRVKQELSRILKETTAGDPISLLKWTAKSTRSIAEELTRRGYLGRCLHEMNYSLQGNVKSLEGLQHSDRGAPTLSSSYPPTPPDRNCA